MSSLGPIELVVIGFPETPSSGRIAAEIQDLIDREVVTLVDGVFITKDDDGEVTFVEIEQMDSDDSIKALSQFLDDSEGLLSEEDEEEIAAQLEPGSSALMLVFENTWVKPVRDAIYDAGGVVMAQLRVPGVVVDEVMAALAAE
jgi:uncharacterized membrane protein